MQFKEGDRVIVLSMFLVTSSFEVGEFKPYGPKMGKMISRVAFKLPDGTDSFFDDTRGPYLLEDFALYSETLVQQLKERIAVVRQRQEALDEAQKDLREFFDQAKEERQ